MDNGPFRGQGQDSKQTPSVEVPIEKPQQVERTTKEMSQTGYSSRKGFTDQTSNSSGNRFLVPVLIAVPAIILALVGWFVWSALQGSAVGVDGSKYQVVSLSDGQVYFGKLASADKEHMKLTNVYYLQPIASATDEEEASDSSDLKDAASDENNFKLVKFTDIVYGPENEMIIAREQIVHYDNLDPEGKVAKAIEQYKDN